MSARVGGFGQSRNSFASSGHRRHPMSEKFKGSVLALDQAGPSPGWAQQTGISPRSASIRFGSDPGGSVGGLSQLPPLA